jgi:uncharacterized protein (TIGR02996 family)
MPDDTAFVHAIQGDPQDDAPRLIYADWLDEYGQPRAADFLRTEAQLAKLSLGSDEVRRLRSRLWHAWSDVEPRWLLTFTQPRMLRANPTPLPSAWNNFGLGALRPAEGTYGRWHYHSLPALPVDELRGEFQYLPARRQSGRKGNPARYRQQLEQMKSDADWRGLRLPAAFVSFMSDPALHRKFPSVTDCFFTLPDDESPIRVNPSGEGWHVHFYCDSQFCLLWDLLIHPKGGHCVIARLVDYFDRAPPDADDDQTSSTGPRAWFVAPSFEAFVYRVWVENQVWDAAHADFRRRSGTRPPITPEIQSYMDHYRKLGSPVPAPRW